MLNGQIGKMLENELNNVFKPTKRDTFIMFGLTLRGKITDTTILCLNLTLGKVQRWAPYPLVQGFSKSKHYWPFSKKGKTNNFANNKFCQFNMWKMYGWLELLTNT